MEQCGLKTTKQQMQLGKLIHNSNINPLIPSSSSEGVISTQRKAEQGLLSRDDKWIHLMVHVCMNTVIIIHQKESQCPYLSG